MVSRCFKLILWRGEGGEGSGKASHGYFGQSWPVTVLLGTEETPPFSPRLIHPFLKPQEDGKNILSRNLLLKSELNAY
jgi:hypothetical protein